MNIYLFEFFFSFYFSGFSIPTDDIGSDEYQNDDDKDLDYDDSDSEQRESTNSVNSRQNNDNSRQNIDTNPAYFRLSNYTETVKAGENATLKCDVENLNSNYPLNEFFFLIKYFNDLFIYLFDYFFFFR